MHPHTRTARLPEGEPSEEQELVGIDLEGHHASKANTNTRDRPRAGRPIGYDDESRDQRAVNQGRVYRSTDMPIASRGFLISDVPSVPPVSAPLHRNGD